MAGVASIGGMHVEEVVWSKPLTPEEQNALVSTLSGRNVVRQTFSGAFGTVWTTWFPDGTSVRFPSFAGALRAATRGKPKAVDTLQGLPITGDYHDACTGGEQADGEAGAGSEVRDTPPREEEGCP